MKIHKFNPTGRSTDCTEVRIGGVEMVFSYATLIGVRYQGRVMRRENVWGPTTGRHISETGLREAEIVSAERLNECVTAYLYAETYNAVAHPAKVAAE